MSCSRHGRRRWPPPPRSPRAPRYKSSSSRHLSFLPCRSRRRLAASSPVSAPLPQPSLSSPERREATSATAAPSLSAKLRSRRRPVHRRADPELRPSPPSTVRSPGIALMLRPRHDHPRRASLCVTDSAPSAATTRTDSAEAGNARAHHREHSASERVRAELPPQRRAPRPCTSASPAVTSATPCSPRSSHRQQRGNHDVAAATKRRDPVRRPWPRPRPAPTLRPRRHPELHPETSRPNSEHAAVTIVQIRHLAKLFSATAGEPPEPNCPPC